MPLVKRNLVFTSAGKNSNIEQWLDGVSFDLYVVSYTEEMSPLKDRVKYLSYRKGGKFQNLFHTFQTAKDILEQYTNILVIDDDIVISGASIDRLFQYIKQLNVKILQPSFSHAGKISHPITGMHAFSKYRFTNFVEVTCPLFSTDYLFEFLDQFDPRANGGGVDFWFCNKATFQINQIAVIDEIWCTNPLDTTKQGVREIDRFQSRQVRNAAWQNVKSELSLNFPENVFQTYSVVYHFKASQVLNYASQKMKKLGLRAKNFAYSVLRWI